MLNLPRFAVPPAALVPAAHAGLAPGLREHGGLERGGHSPPLGLGRQEARRHRPFLKVSLDTSWFYTVAEK